MKTFWSIERAVAFVVAPVVSIASGLLTQAASTGTIASAHNTGTSYLLSGLVSSGTFASFWKWLDGRQKYITPYLGDLTTVATKVGQLSSALPPAERASLLADIDRLVGVHVTRLVSQDSDIAHTFAQHVAEQVGKLRADLSSLPGPAAQTVGAVLGDAGTVASAVASVAADIADVSYTAPNDPAPTAPAVPPPVTATPTATAPQPGQ